MQIHKVGSNNGSFFNGIPEAMRISSLNIEDKPITPTIKTLGLVYKSDIDAFTFMFEPDSQIPWTTRTILSNSARIFDPLRLLSPVIVTAKLLVQLAWNHAKNWDTPLPTQIIHKWEKWVKNTKRINEIIIP